MIWTTQFNRSLSVVLSGLLPLSACKTAPQQTESLVKVTNSNESKEPYSIWLFQGNFLCTATIVGPDLLLTAAHCAKSANLTEYAAYQNFPKVGPGPVAYKIKERFIHPDYKEGELNPLVDLALLRTDKKFDAAPKKLQMELPEPGDTIKLVGYGQTIAGDPASNPNALQHSATTSLPVEIEIKTINGAVRYVDKSGRDSYSQDDLVTWSLFSDAFKKGILNFCGSAGPDQEAASKCKGASIASGDSGSAIFIDDRIIAVTSTVAVVPDRVWSNAPLVAHPEPQKFFCKAKAKGLTLSWVHRDNSPARLTCR